MIGSDAAFSKDSSQAGGRGSTAYMPSMNSVVITVSLRNVEASGGFLALAVWKNVRTPRNGLAVLSLPSQFGIGQTIRSSPSASVCSGICQGPVMKYGDLPLAKVSRAMS